MIIQHGGASVGTGSVPQSLAEISAPVPTITETAEDRPVAQAADAAPAPQIDALEPVLVTAVLEMPLADLPPPPVRVAYSRAPSVETTRLLMERYGPSPAVVLTGTASTYNPFSVYDEEPGGSRTASGEFYDPDAWTAAIKTKLRDHFAGVRFGKKYQPAFALVESGGLQLIVRINDVGPLKPGRIIDLNERAMRYFDPTLRRGLLTDVTVTPLAGTDWTAGPVDGQGRMSVAIQIE